jgi:CheY-like chemotaxis protein
MATRVAPPEVSGSPQGWGSAGRVLVVDDDDAGRALCSLNLRLAGFDVLEAEDGRRGLEVACSHRPDLAVLDVRMPRLDGFGLAAALRGDARTRAIPFVFLSGDADAANKARARALGAVGYFTKPFDPSVLEALVGSLAGGRAPGAQPATHPDAAHTDRQLQPQTKETT